MAGKRQPSSSAPAVIDDIYRKIERERSLITGATAMRNNTSNADVKSRCDSNIRESRKNIEYLEKTLKELQSQRNPKQRVNYTELGTVGLLFILHQVLAECSD